MSRIDEALRRIRAGAEPEPMEAPEQTEFAPAWAVSPTEEEAKRKPVSNGIARPSVGHVSDRNAAPTPGMISFSSEWRERLAGSAQGDPALTEQFRRLAATLHHAQQANGLRSVMVTSASPGDGKTLTAINLAIVLAESYRYNVLLIDADLRRPSIPNIAELGEGSGLSEVLRASTEQKLALVPITSRLTLLPAGQPVSNSIEALTSPRMRQILEEANTRFDWVVLDAPPVGLTSDARLLTSFVGGAIFVIHAGKSQYPAVQKGIDLLGREHIIGVVLNGVEDAGGEEYTYYGPAQTPGQP